MSGFIDELIAIFNKYRYYTDNHEDRRIVVKHINEKHSRLGIGYDGNADLNDNDIVDVDDIGTTADEIDDIYVGTNQRIYFGDGQEFSIYYNGSNGIIEW